MDWLVPLALCGLSENPRILAAATKYDSPIAEESRHGALSTGSFRQPRKVASLAAFVFPNAWVPWRVTRTGLSGVFFFATR